MSETAAVKYVFLDIVEFTKRSVEAQADVVQVLNEVVSEALKTVKGGQNEERIAIATGDGIAVALIHSDIFDAHLQVACEILALLEQRNQVAPKENRKFKVRIGLNENVDNIILDINGNRNVAGAGISMAQRIMDQADGSQILVGQTVYETLHPREKYMDSFRTFQARGKHGISFPVHQFVMKGLPGLNNDVPSVFAVAKAETPKFTKLTAYYVANAWAAREFLRSRHDDVTREDIATILLYFLAEDCVIKSETPEHDRPAVHTWKSGEASFQEQYDHYDAMDTWVVITWRD